jgi:hypothetical protein
VTPDDGLPPATEEIDVELPRQPANEKPYDPEPRRERMRGALASGLVLILAAVAAAAWITIWARLATEAEVKDLLGVMLPPVVALVGSAIGFYFGGKPPGK